MSIFYRSASVIVTDTQFKVIGTPERVFAIGQFEHVYVVRADTRVAGPRMWRKLWPTAATVVISTIIAAVEAADHAGGAQLISAMALAVCGVSLLFSLLRADHVNELWAVINGRHLCLFREPDQQVFGQIRRALMRAREHLT